jgi:hypothetical protein
MKSKKHVRAFIESLLSSRGPLYIERPALLYTFRTVPARVIAVVVGPINRVKRRGPEPDLAEKDFKRVSYSRADLDPAPSISLIKVVFRIGATLFHVEPRVVLRSVSHAVSGFSLTRSIGSKTPAGLHVAPGKMAPGYVENLSAVAKTLRSELARLVVISVFYYNESCKSISNVYNESGWHVLSLLRLENLLARLEWSLRRLLGPFSIVPQKECHNSI